MRPAPSSATSPARPVDRCPSARRSARSAASHRSARGLRSALGVTPDGTLYYADIGVIGPGPIRPGRVMRVTFDSNGLPGVPEEVDTGLAFPDGIGIVVLG